MLRLLHDNAAEQKALGRISNGLYIITATKGEIKSAMVASWVTQASLTPLIAIAIAKDRAIPIWRTRLQQPEEVYLIKNQSFDRYPAIVRLVG